MNQHLSGKMKTQKPLFNKIHLFVNSPHKGQWRGALMLSLICAWINGWVNNGEAGDLRRHRAHYDVTVMKTDAKARKINSLYKRALVGNGNLDK